MNGVCRTAVDALHAKTSPSTNPLVRTGYCIRSRHIQTVLERFLRHYQEEDRNILVLGAGLDPALFDVVCNRNGIGVLEMDLPDICRTKKRDILQNENNNWLSSNEEDADTNMHCSGTHPHTKSSYRLLSCDLNDVDHLRQLLSLHVTPGIPTLVISEVVLCYLSSVDRILSYCGTMGWHFVAYEPLGPQIDSNSVVQSYVKQYVQRFREKLQKDGTNTTMEPVGSSLDHVRERLQKAGFRFTHAHHPTANPHDVQSLMDEHAALVLHMRSYAMAVASNDLLMQHILCGDTIKKVQPNVWLTEVVRDDDDEGIRAGFYDTYVPYFQQYPAIRKMHEQVEQSDFKCDIGGYYSNRFGRFWVILHQNIIVGGLGIRRLEADERKTRALPSPCFEIQRVFVLKQFRRRGLAQILMQTAMDFAGKHATITATTLSILEEANQLYTKCGFELSASHSKGSLTFSTYIREAERHDKK